ncbi:MAG: hypothetical protein DHS20C11_16830 [Lysobacteraceae bacterium]|nr:MAG: hypothetical protein DHS20C11_16830 [Xanthomonadaceae bacterium]
MPKLFAFAFLSLFATIITAQEPTEYRMGPGDEIDIVVYDEPDMSPTVTVSQQGTIRYPFLGTLNVTGKTVDEVEAMLMSGLKGPYLIDPKIQVSIRKYRPFFILGEVQLPGSYAYHPGLNVRQALSLAGGMTERGSPRKIFVVSEGAIDDESTRVDLDDLVRPGDTITVEQSFF